MGSAEQDASNKSDINAKDSHEKETASAADRPSLMSPPQRPVRPVRPAAAPEVSVAVKPVAKTADAVMVPKAAVTEKAPEPAAPEPDPAAYRYQPIAPPSEPMQYRAIGLVRGTYEPSEADQLNRGNLTTEDGHVIDSVLLGRITSLVKKHIDLTMPHLWVVYPRTRRELDNDDQDLHLQIVGVWEPETLGLPGEAPASEDEDEDEDETGEAAPEKPDLADLPPVDDNFFSIRGEVIKYTPEDKCIAVKILQGAKRTPGTSKPFKLLLHGTIEGRTVGYFWDFKVKREAKVLVLSEASPVGIVPPKKRAKGSGGAGPRRGKPGMRSGPGGSRPPMPSRRPTGVKGSDSGTDTRSESVSERPASRPKKRDEPPESSAE